MVALAAALALGAILWVAPTRTLAQDTPGASPQLYLLPAERTDVVLETHLADLQLLPGDSAAAVMEATYRLRNPTESGVVLGLRLVPGGDRTLSSFQGLNLSADGVGLPLEPAGEGFVTQLPMGADGRVTLRLTYQVGLGSGALSTVRYAPAILNQWPGNISLRVQMIMPEAIGSDLWMELTPEGWTYGVMADPTATGIKWLYDANVPENPFLLRFITPATWAQLREAQQAAVGGAPPATFVRLGDLYRRLYREATGPALRARFYAQAVAAYSAGVSSGAAAAPQDLAELHAGLAYLYRDQIVQADAGTWSRYAQLLVDEGQAALALLPADDPRRDELTQWQVDGLTVLLGEARSRQDWPQALTLVDQLAQMPPGMVDPTQLAEERRGLLVQQALQFMQQGNRDAALALAGDQIAAADVAVPAEATPLFAAWQITVTSSPQALHLDALGTTTPQQHEAALAALQAVVQLWETGIDGQSGYTIQVEDVQPPQESGLPTGVRLTVDFPASANGFLLARILPPRDDWAFLQTLLTQLAPSVERQREMVWQQVTLSQPLDLTQARAQWTGVAAGLEQQADAFAAAGRQAGAAGPGGAEQALRAQVQAANYQAAAGAWRQLTQQSWLLFRFEVDDPLFTTLNRERPSRAWFAAPESPSQMLVFRAQVLDLNRLLVLILVTLAGLLAVASLLWWLL